MRSAVKSYASEFSFIPVIQANCAAWSLFKEKCTCEKNWQTIASTLAPEKGDTNHRLAWLAHPTHFFILLF
jgi:hypothetical protein